MTHEPEEGRNLDNLPIIDWSGWSTDDKTDGKRDFDAEVLEIEGDLHQDLIELIESVVQRTIYSRRIDQLAQELAAKEAETTANDACRGYLSSLDRDQLIEQIISHSQAIGQTELEFEDFRDFTLLEQDRLKTIIGYLGATCAALAGALAGVVLF